MQKGNLNLHLHLSISPKIILALFSSIKNIKIDLSQTFLIGICNIYICPNRVLIYIIDHINVIIIMYIFLRDDIPKHVRRRRTLFWCRRRPCHSTKITFIKSKNQDASFLNLQTVTLPIRTLNLTSSLLRRFPLFFLLHSTQCLDDQKASITNTYKFIYL